MLQYILLLALSGASPTYSAPVIEKGHTPDLSLSLAQPGATRPLQPEHHDLLQLSLGLPHHQPAGSHDSRHGSPSRSVRSTALLPLFRDSPARDTTPVTRLSLHEAPPSSIPSSSVDEADVRSAPPGHSSVEVAAASRGMLSPARHVASAQPSAGRHSPTPGISSQAKESPVADQRATGHTSPIGPSDPHRSSPHTAMEADKQKAKRKSNGAYMEKNRLLAQWMADPATQHLPPPDAFLSRSEVRRRRLKRLQAIGGEEIVKYAKQQDRISAGFKKMKKRMRYEMENPGEPIPEHLQSSRQKANMKAHGTFDVIHRSEAKSASRKKGHQRTDARLAWNYEHGAKGVSPPFDLMTKWELDRLHLRRDTARYKAFDELEQKHMSETGELSNGQFFPEVSREPAVPGEAEWLRHRRRQIWAEHESGRWAPPPDNRWEKKARNDMAFHNGIFGEGSNQQVNEQASQQQKGKSVVDTPSDKFVSLQQLYQKPSQVATPKQPSRKSQRLAMQPPSRHHDFAEWSSGSGSRADSSE